jgi:hypothetical protein
VIVSLHVATGAAAGTLLRSPGRAAVAGPLLHAALDVIPHEDIDSVRFELASGLTLIALLASARGPLDAAVVGAITSSAPDLEHVLPLPRPGGRKLFPTHRSQGPHRRAGVPVWLQLVATGMIAAVFLRNRTNRRWSEGGAGIFSSQLDLRRRYAGKEDSEEGGRKDRGRLDEGEAEKEDLAR